MDMFYEDKLLRGKSFGNFVILTRFCESLIREKNELRSQLDKN